MNWLVLSYFLSLGTLTYTGQTFDPNAAATFTMNGYQTTLGFELQGIDNHLFVGGSVQTWESPAVGLFFSPSEALYKFNAGVRWNGLELGYRHECDHSIISSAADRARQGMQANRDEFYLSFKGSAKLF